MKTRYYTAISLDGFIATADDSLEWLFRHGLRRELCYSVPRPTMPATTH